MIKFPEIDPYIVRFGDLGITWYSLSYVFGIILGWQYANYIIDKTKSSVSKKQMDDYISWMIIAIIVGGRFGHVILYDPIYYMQNPVEILQTYKGGMAFHGGLAGVGIASYFFCRKYKIKFFSLTDLLAQGTPIGLFLGRIANFINAELYGEVTTMPWGIIFPGAGPLPRHPSQLYEAFMEGVILFIILAYFSLVLKKYKNPGFLTGIFLIGYSLSRIICEFFRVPDFEVSYLSSGQIYSFPMIILGLYFIKNSYGTSKSRF